MTGGWPNQTIDHIDGDPTNNKWDNLRDVSQQTNNRNIHKARTHSGTATLGVGKFRNKFRARITVDGKSIHLGLYASKDAAHAAYLQAKQTYHY